MNNKDSFRIILRYAVDPENALEENLLQLQRFAQESTLNEVMFLVAPEERSSGHPTIAQSEPWMEGMLRAKDLLAQLGVEVSVNPWTTTYHSGRGRKLQAGQDFRLMVGETGRENGMTACPLDETWQAYLCEYFSWIARELEPVALWVEDDWRLHNHGPEMGYGGCFCESCMNRFSLQVGRQISRQELVEKITRPGPPQALRAEWIRFAQVSLRQPAERLQSALKLVRPEMRIGFMTSLPDVHSIEGRDWNQLLEVWSGEGQRPLIRPHMPPYTEEAPIITSPGCPRQTIANLDSSADIYPELENSPRCGQYSVSHAYSLWEIYNAIAFGSRGITINHFDNMGMNTLYDRGFGKAIGRHRRAFDALMKLKIDDRQSLGVRVLFSPEVACHKRTEQSGSLKELKADSIAWSRVFYALGIAHSFTRSLDAGEEAVFAVSDQTLRCFSDEELRKLLGKNLILDLPSLEILVERGFGSAAGVDSVERVKLQDEAYSIEEVSSDFIGTLEGGVKARMCAQRCADPIGKIRYLSGARLLSTILNGSLEALFPASAIYENQWGGRIFSSVYPLGRRQFYMAYFNRVRQQYWTRLLFQLAGPGSRMLVASGHPLQVHAHDLDNGLFVAVSNVIYDPVDGFDLRMHESALRGRQFRVLESDGSWRPFSPEVDCRQGVATVSIKLHLHPLQSAFLTLT